MTKRIVWHSVSTVSDAAGRTRPTHGTADGPTPDPASDADGRDVAEPGVIVPSRREVGHSVTHEE
jgi:hypothetical protein